MLRNAKSTKRFADNDTTILEVVYAVPVRNTATVIMAASTVLALTFEKCEHVPQKQLMTAVSNNANIFLIFNEHHSFMISDNKSFTCFAHVHLGKNSTPNSR